MHKAAQECDRTLIVLSPDYISAMYTQPEWSQAFSQDPTGEKRLLVPVRVKKCELDGLHPTRVYIDFLEPPPDSKTSRRSHLLDELLKGVSLERCKPTEEPPLPEEPKNRENINSLQQNPIKDDLIEDATPSRGTRKFFGKQRDEVLQSLTTNWPHSGSTVTILQGFPGTGKSQLAAEVGSKFSKCIDSVEPPSEAENSAQDLLIDLAEAINNGGISDVWRELEKDGDPYKILYQVIHSTPLLIVVDEFQRLFGPENTSPPKQWQKLVEKLNNSRNSKGRLLLISNRLIKKSRWCESCNFIVLNGLADDEAKNYFLDLLDNQDLVSKVPASRLCEIGRRLGGNPRAIKTLVSGLVSDSLDDLLSLSPGLFDTGDVKIDPILVEDFEREIIERTLTHVENESLRFMRWASVHRRPFDKSALEMFNASEMGVDCLRKKLIDRFLMINSILGDELHPLAREISVTRLSEVPGEWSGAHSLAANYYLDRFKVSQRKEVVNISSSYAELRHHLYESARIEELRKVTDRVVKLALSHIDKPAQSKIPESTETLEERIALISIIPEGQIPMGLEYHLALCLKHRNTGDDYKKALIHIRKAVGHRAYYGAWLLLIELEYSTNGIDAMLDAQKESVKYLSSGHDLFSVYHRCAQILRKDDKVNDAIDLLERGINSRGISCLSPLISLCADYMEKSGKFQDAISLIEGNLERDLPELGILYKRCATLMATNGQIDEAITLLRKAIEKPGMTKVYSLYLVCSELLYKDGKKEDAISILKEGLTNTNVIDPVEMYSKCAETLVKQGQSEEAVSVMKDGLMNKSIKEPERLQVYFAELMEKLDQAGNAASFLKRSLSSNKTPSSFLYLSCAKILFHMKKIDEAIDILRDGISKPKLKEQRQLIQMCAELLFRKGKVGEALDILKQGIENPLVDNKFTLYRAYSDLLIKENRLNDAISILNAGINAPAVENKSVLIQACAKILDRNGRRNEAVDMLKDSLKKPGITGLTPIYQTCANIMAKDGRRKEAIQLLLGALNGPKIGNLVSLYRPCAELMVKEGKKNDARELIVDGMNIFSKDKSLKDYLMKLS